MQNSKDKQKIMLGKVKEKKMWKKRRSEEEELVSKTVLVLNKEQ